MKNIFFSTLLLLSILFSVVGCKKDAVNSKNQLPVLITYTGVYENGYATYSYDSKNRLTSQDIDIEQYTITYDDNNDRPLKLEYKYNGIVKYTDYFEYDMSFNIVKIKSFST